MLTRAAARCSLPHKPIPPIHRSNASVSLCAAKPPPPPQSPPHPPTVPLITSIASPAVCERVWGHQQQAPIKAFIIHGSPPQPTELMTLTTAALSPVSLTKAAIGEFIQQQLRSRSAVVQQVQAAVLSAPYLPSQLAEIAGMAETLQLAASFWREPLHGLHVLLYQHHTQQLAETAGQQDTQPAMSADDQLQLQLKQLDTWRPLLGRMFGDKVYPLKQSELETAKQEETRLRRQLQLWDASIWNAALQQLESRKAVRRCFAVNSLMGQQGLQAVRNLVAKHPGLSLTEVRRSSSNSVPDPTPQLLCPRTRRGSRALRQAAQAKQNAAKAAADDDDDVVLVVSRGELSPEQLADLPCEVYTDYIETGDSVSSAKPAKSPMRRLFDLAQDIAIQQQKAMQKPD